MSDTAYARESAKIIRDAAVKMVNAVIIPHEARGLRDVSTDMLRRLADSINELALPGDSSTDAAS